MLFQAICRRHDRFKGETTPSAFYNLFGRGPDSAAAAESGGGTSGGHWDYAGHGPLMTPLAMSGAVVSNCCQDIAVPPGSLASARSVAAGEGSEASPDHVWNGAAAAMGTMRPHGGSSEGGEGGFGTHTNYTLASWAAATLKRRETTETSLGRGSGGRQWLLQNRMQIPVIEANSSGAHHNNHGTIGPGNHGKRRESLASWVSAVLLTGDHGNNEIDDRAGE